MRNISTAALAKLSQQYAVEPIIIVRVYWYDLSYDYADKNENFEFFGHVLNLSGLDSSATTGSVTITLDDSQGYLFDIFNNIDTHKKVVKILQWFEGMPREDAFVIFDGLINTPMEWTEAERTFTFTAVNIIENREMGFSFEEGRFSIPVKVVGKPWPIVVGTVLKVPALQITEQPDGVLAEGFGVINHAAYEKEIRDIRGQMQRMRLEALRLASAIGQAEADAREETFADFQEANKNIGEITFINGSAVAQGLINVDSRVADTDADKQALADINVDYLNAISELNKVVYDLEQKEVYEKSYVHISSFTLPRDREIEVDINRRRFRVFISGQVMNILKEVRVIRDVQTSYYNTLIQRSISSRYISDIQIEKFVWFDGGARIELASEPIAYVAALDHCTILGVFGKANNGIVQVPNNYYTVGYQDFGSGLIATTITLNRALHTHQNQVGDKIWDSDELFCDIVGYVPPRWESIVNWAVDTFANYHLDPVLYPDNRDSIVTNLTIDPVSFTNVAKMVNDPMNFALLTRPNVFQFLKDLCFQARVKVWLNGNQLRFMYLPMYQTAVAAFTEDDVIENTLVLTCTPTESLVTKLTATWKYSYNQPESNLMIARYNVLKYGLQEQSYNYFALSQHDVVYNSLAFWANRLGSSWKILRFKTNLQKLNVEVNDPVHIFIYGYDVVGIVERVSYDSLANQIDFTVVLPIRWGERDLAVDSFGDITEVNGSSVVVNTGSPYFLAQDNGYIFEHTKITTFKFGSFKFAPPGEIVYGPQLDASSSGRNIGQAVTSLTNVGVNYDRPDGIATANNSVTYSTAQASDSGGSGSTVLIGRVVSGSGNQYRVKAGKNTYNVTQVYIGAKYNLFVGTVVYIVKTGKKWFMQAPVWYDE